MSILWSSHSCEMLMGNGLRNEIRPSAVVEEALVEGVCELSGEGCLKTQKSPTMDTERTELS